jgi:hypothetical protein
VKPIPMVAATCTVAYLWLDHGWLALFAGILLYMFGHFAGTDEN